MEPNTFAALLAKLRNADCGYCDAGSLRRGDFEGNPAIRCPACGTPAAQVG